jgi:hypothetical protein
MHGQDSIAYGLWPVVASNVVVVVFFALSFLYRANSIRH